jgi:hypothetical protein
MSLPLLGEVDLENSYVLGLEANDHHITFRLDVALLPGHDRYRTPGPQEQNCYRRAVLTIDDARSVRWSRVVMRSSRDATGEADFGSVDVWLVQDGEHHIEGDWGVVEVQGGRIDLEFSD